jgi:hypothetical protein
MPKLKSKKRRLSNIYVCGKKSKGHILPVTELLISSAITFEVTSQSIPFLIDTFKYAQGSWFKFLVIDDDDDDDTDNDTRNHRMRMFVCNGAAINRHSVIYIHAIASILSSRGIGTEPDSKYYTFLKAYNDIIACKDSKRGYTTCSEQLKRTLNREIKKNFECMRVVSAGSGTVFETRDGDGVTNYEICLNTKSGHYRPSLKDVDFAKSLLENIIQKMDVRGRIKVSSRYKSSKQTIRKVFGDRAESKVGICIPKNKI